MILNKQHDFPSAPLFKELKWLMFTDRVNYHTAVLVYKCVNNQAPEYLCSLFTLVKNNYSLRSISDENLALPKFRLTSYKQSFAYSGVMIWNNIPPAIRKSESLRQFKKNYYNHLLQKY